MCCRSDDISLQRQTRQHKGPTSMEISVKDGDSSFVVGIKTKSLEISATAKNTLKYFTFSCTCSSSTDTRYHCEHINLVLLRFWFHHCDFTSNWKYNRNWNKTMKYINRLNPVSFRPLSVSPSGRRWVLWKNVTITKEGLVWLIVFKCNKMFSIYFQILQMGHNYQDMVHLHRACHFSSTFIVTLSQYEHLRSKKFQFTSALIRTISISLFYCKVPKCNTFYDYIFLRKL